MIVNIVAIILCILLSDCYIQIFIYIYIYMVYNGYCIDTHESCHFYDLLMDYTCM